jgi:S-formylglutathione hydrolase FrmB
MVALFALALAVGQLTSRGWGRRVAAVPAVLLVVLSAGLKINAVYQYRPTLASVLGLPVAGQVALHTVRRHVPVALASVDRPLVDTWRPPAGMPSAGRVARVTIPASVSGFPARPGWVYLPPAYLGPQRPLLPVLVLIAGQPGWPSDWLTAGRLSETMNDFAAHHLGLAPVVVMPDATGSAAGDPLCFDSALGRVQSYLADDVPAWTLAHLQVNPDRRAWAIGGFSYGGTCALQLAVNAAWRYPTYLDISGDAEPTLGTHRHTVAAAFGGNEAAFRAANPLDVLARSRLPGTAGRLVVGRDDRTAVEQARQVVTSARHAGVDAQLGTVPGAHTWAAAGTGLTGQLNWLATRLGILPPSPPTVRVVR